MDHVKIGWQFLALCFLWGIPTQERSPVQYNGRRAAPRGELFVDQEPFVSQDFVLGALARELQTGSGGAPL